jgi:hypothetical protein
MQQQHQYVLGDWTLPQHPHHASVGMTPSLHLWSHNAAPGPKLPGSKMYQSSEDHAGRLNGKNTALQQPASLHVQSQNGESFSNGFNEPWHEHKEDGRGQHGTFLEPSSAPHATSDLHRLMLAQLGQIQHHHSDPRQQPIMPFCSPYSSQRWNPDDMGPPGHMPGAMHAANGNGYDCGLPTTALSNGDMQQMTSYMNHDSTAMYNGMRNGGIHASTIPPPVTDLRTCVPFSLFRNRKS